jgi:hypothetical protein
MWHLFPRRRGFYQVKASAHSSHRTSALLRLRFAPTAALRAKCLAMLVASPRLFEPQCGTPRQMELANTLCRYRELVKAQKADG